MRAAPCAKAAPRALPHPNRRTNPTGRLGATQLAGVGVALSVYNTATKLVQVPLLSIVTTNVAAARGAALAAAAAAADEAEQRPQGRGDGGSVGGGGSDGREAEAVSAAASAALLVAAAVGVAVGALLVAGGPVLARAWGIGPGSPLRGPALEFLTLRALGAPISITLLVAQVGMGCGRGEGAAAAPPTGAHPLHVSRTDRLGWSHSLLPPGGCGPCSPVPAGLLSGPAGHAHAAFRNAGGECTQHRCALKRPRLSALAVPASSRPRPALRGVSRSPAAAQPRAAAPANRALLPPRPPRSFGLLPDLRRGPRRPRRGGGDGAGSGGVARVLLISYSGWENCPAYSAGKTVRSSAPRRGIGAGIELAG